MTTRTRATKTGAVRHTSVRGSTRRTGAELRALGWLCRHPLFALLPLLAVLAVRTWGALVAGYAAAGLVAVLLVWWRAHPASFDPWAAPRLPPPGRRWTPYP